jgi:hypothetical protein
MAPFLVLVHVDMAGVVEPAGGPSIKASSAGITAVLAQSCPIWRKNAGEMRATAGCDTKKPQAVLRRAYASRRCQNGEVREMGKAHRFIP